MRIGAALVIVLAACGTTAQLIDGGADSDVADVVADVADVADVLAIDASCSTLTATCDAGLPQICDGCAPPTVLATCQQGPGAIVLDDQTVYWINQGVYESGGGKVPISYKDGAVMKCAKSGCNGTATPIAISLFDAWTLSIAVSGSSVYFGSVIDAGAWMLGAHDTKACSTINSPWLGSFGGYMLAADDASVFFTDYSGCRVYGCAAAGCTEPTLMWLAPNTNNQLTTGIAVDATDVYWGDTHGDLFRCAKSGCGGNPTLIGQTPLLTEIGHVAVDDKNVYATGWGVMSCAKSGCTTATVLATNANYESAIASDGVNVYWLANGVYRCAVTGCTTPTLIAAGASYASSIAVDDVNVYFSDAPSGTIFALPK